MYWVCGRSLPGRERGRRRFRGCREGEERAKMEKKREGGNRRQNTVKSTNALLGVSLTLKTVYGVFLHNFGITGFRPVLRTTSCRFFDPTPPPVYNLQRIIMHLDRILAEKINWFGLRKKMLRLQKGDPLWLNFSGGRNNLNQRCPQSLSSPPFLLQHTYVTKFDYKYKYNIINNNQS